MPYNIIVKLLCILAFKMNLFSVIIHFVFIETQNVFIFCNSDGIRP